MNKNLLISKISKKDCAVLLQQYHYLAKESISFRSGFNYGLYKDEEFIGVCIFHGVSAPETLKGCLGLYRNNQKGFYELGRLCVKAGISAKNLLSWFVSKSIRLLKKETFVRGILSYADSRYHKGYIYQACNFKYFGLSAVKKDFWFLQDDGSYKKHSRGKIKGFSGEWRPRPQKHRYFMLFDRSLKVLWKESPYPKGKNKNPQ